MIDLESLATAVGLASDSAAALVFRAAIALQRRHRPGARLTGDMGGTAIDDELRWRERDRGIDDHEDINRVTEEGAEAIALRAESLPSGSWEAQSAFRDVSAIEEAIAAIASANAVEGEIARLGAVTAALSAGETLRAARLAERYLGDALSLNARAKLDELQRQADAEIQKTVADEPNVQLVRFRLRAA